MSALDALAEPLLTSARRQIAHSSQCPLRFRFRRRGRGLGVYAYVYAYTGLTSAPELTVASAAWLVYDYLTSLPDEVRASSGSRSCLS